MVKIPFSRKSDRARSSEVSSEQLVNCFMEVEGDDAKGQFPVYAAPGLKPFAEATGKSRCRGQRIWNDKHYAVIGNTLYEIRSGGKLTSKGTVPGSNPVVMDGSENQLVIVTNPHGYVFDGTNVAKIIDDFFVEGGASSVAFLNGKFLFTRPNSGVVFFSSTLDATTYSGLDFFTAESADDNAVAVYVSKLEIFIFGTQSTEIWHNVAGDFPYERLGGAKLEVGLASPHTIVTIDNTMYWLGDDGLVYRLEGFTPVPISNGHVVRSIGQFTSLNLATAFGFDQDAHKFYVLNHPQRTLVYDIGQSIWHGEKSSGLARRRYETCLRAHSRNIVGDILNGKLYELDPDTYDEDGTALEREMISGPVHVNGRRFIVNELFIDFESGVGLASGQGSNPKVMLQWSDDGGKTWSNELWSDLFPIGVYRGRAVWRNLGISRERVFRVRISDPVKLVYIDNEADIEVAA